MADAFNHGYVQLWSQDRRYEWTNRYDAANLHFAGGFGWLRVGRRSGQRPLRRPPERARAGCATSAWATRARPRASRASRSISTCTRRSATTRCCCTTSPCATRPRTPGARPGSSTGTSTRSTRPPRRAPARAAYAGCPRCARSRARSRRPRSTAAPLTIFAAALRGPAGGHSGDTREFFGSGSRARPAAVTKGRLNGALAPAAPEGSTGRAMLAFSASVRLAPHASVTLRYAYGAAHAVAIPKLVRRYRAARAPLAASEAGWRSWLPQIRLGSGRAWLSRELQWDAYTVRSGATYEECFGRHIISQGGYYQYDLGFQGAFRDPAAAPAADGLRRPLAGPRRAALLERRSSRAPAARSRTRCRSSARRRTRATRTTSTCG